MIAQHRDEVRAPRRPGGKVEEQSLKIVWCHRLVEARTLPACAIQIEKSGERIDYLFLAVSPAFADATGIHDAVGRRMRELRPATEEFWFELFDHVARTGEPTDFEHQAKLLDAGFRGFAFRVGEPEDLQVLVVFENVSEEARMMQFGATLAHELRAPIAPIVNGTRLLKDLAASLPQAQTILSMMDRQLVQLNALVEDLMDVGSLHSRDPHPRDVRVNLHHIITSSLETCAPAFESGRLDLRIECDGSPLEVRGNERRLTQVFVNVIANSQKFTPPGGHIVVRLSRADDAAIVEVRDDGIGIASTDLPHIFDLFRQAPGHRFDPKRGLGIGLAVVRHIVEIHGGSVSATSDGLGHGSRFEVRLPLASPGSA